MKYLYILYKKQIKVFPKHTCLNISDELEGGTGIYLNMDYYEDGETITYNNSVIFFWKREGSLYAFRLTRKLLSEIGTSNFKTICFNHLRGCVIGVSKR